MSIMKSLLHDLMQLVIKTDLPEGITVQQIVDIEPIKEAVKRCRKLVIEEVDILVTIARGLKKKKEKKAA